MNHKKEKEKREKLTTDKQYKQTVGKHIDKIDKTKNVLNNATN